MTDDEITECAKRMWYEREMQFPAYTRMRWEDGTEAARAYAKLEAREHLRTIAQTALGD